MITVKRLKELLNKIPEDSKAFAYEGEDIGFVFRDSSETEEIGFIRAYHGSHEEYTEGFGS
jgi:hypothetical protein